jgi:hypothetical protein
MARSVLNNGDQLWGTWLSLCTQISVDTRLGTVEKAGLAAEVAAASAAAATSGMKPAYIGHFLGTLKKLLLSRQAL